MKEIIEIIALTAIFIANGFWILGFHAATREGMVLPLERWWRWKTPEWRKWNNLINHASNDYSVAFSNDAPTDDIMEQLNSLYESEPETKHYRPFIAKPISECPRCMASVHGLMWSVPVAIHFGLPLWMPAIWVVCLVGLVEVLAGIAWKGGAE